MVSLASDKSVWDAIMKNEEVQKLRESHYTGLYSALHIFGLVDRLFQYSFFSFGYYLLLVV